MKNPLRLFHNLLYNSNALNPATLISAEDEKITLYDGNIRNRIQEEVGRVYLYIDEEYWKGSKSDNENYLSKLINISSKLIKLAELQLEKHTERIVTPRDLNNWLTVYNNMQCVYESLIAILNHTQDYYCENTLKQDNILPPPQKYPHIMGLYIAEELRNKCIENLGKCDTNYMINVESHLYNITVKTEKMSLIIAELNLKEDPHPSEHINTLGSKSTEKENVQIEWRGTAKEFIKYFTPIIESKKLFINGIPDRNPLVKALHSIFIIKSNEKGKDDERIALGTLQTYFKKEASGNTY